MTGYFWNWGVEVDGKFIQIRDFPIIEYRQAVAALDLIYFYKLPFDNRWNPITNARPAWRGTSLPDLSFAPTLESLSAIANAATPPKDPYIPPAIGEGIFNNAQAEGEELESQMGLTLEQMVAAINQGTTTLAAVLELNGTPYDSLDSVRRAKVIEVADEIVRPPVIPAPHPTVLIELFYDFNERDETKDIYLTVRNQTILTDTRVGDEFINIVTGEVYEGKPPGERSGTIHAHYKPSVIQDLKITDPYPEDRYQLSQGGVHIIVDASSANPVINETLVHLGKRYELEEGQSMIFYEEDQLGSRVYYSSRAVNPFGGRFHPDVTKYISVYELEE